MRPAPIEESQVLPGTVRRVFSGPDGDLTGPILPVEVCVGRLPDSGVRTISVRCVLEDGDLERLADGSPVWITFLENITPFDVRVGD